MTKEHTPTPWKVEDWHGDTQIVGPEGSLICIDTAYYPVAPSEGDMAHIVKCVNMHDELVEVLKRAHEEWSELYAERYNEPPTETPYDEVLKKAGAL